MKTNRFSRVDLLGSVAGTLTTAALLPQVVKVVQTKSTHDLSLGMFAIFCLGVFLWIIYGIYLKSKPIILANAVTFLFSSIILYHKLVYG